MSRGPGHALLAAAVTVAGLTGCTQSAGADCPPATAYAGPSELAETIDADRLGTVTDGRDEPGLSTLALESRRSVADLRRRLGPAMARAGLQVLSEDNEGFEAEMYFGADDGTSAVARIRENPLCEGRTTVQISVSRETPEPQPAEGGRWSLQHVHTYRSDHPPAVRGRPRLRRGRTGRGS